MWHELARPQVHGYDLVGATWLGPWTFASVADEKVTRIFEAPRGFVVTVKELGVRGVVESTVRIPEKPQVARTLMTFVRKNGRLQPMCLHWDCQTRRLAKVRFAPAHFAIILTLRFRQHRLRWIHHDQIGAPLKVSLRLQRCGRKLKKSLVMVMR